MRFSSLLVAAQTALGAIVERQSNPACDATCMQAFKAAFAAESSGWATLNFTDDPFYTTPANASGAKPGDLLRWEDVSIEQLAQNWTGIPGGMSLSRFLYMTEDINRNPIPASAFVLLPFSAQTPGCNSKVFKTLAWAHGTAGRSRQCAPSNQKDLYYGWMAPLFYAANGYAVIATDFAGQGTDIPGGFRYEAGYLHAADVAYSLVAARKRIGNILSDEWVVAGHSEGGMTAWRTNERLAMPGQEELLKAGKFLGAVAAAPALRPTKLIPKSIRLAKGGPLGAPVHVYMLQSLVEIYPELKLEDILTTRSLELLPLLNQGCLITGDALFHNLSVTDIFKSTAWLTSKEFNEWQTKINGAGPHKLAAPMMVVQGLGDTLTYPQECEQDFDLTCKAFPDSRAELYLVPELDHGPSFQAAQPYYLPYIKSLFDGLQVQKGCRKVTAAPTNDRYARGGALP
ncbi:hypothetical protein NLU13_4485 [Sarocladium strictum]|uniref:AB hydrolase-1 domain-containing protein n=1 Tax=Sarocladium strictum TaxID=5046 RepID=A0AA39GIY5_SARSR|nr:hypothetical protein NLU13_4485 [Sarocladium strictum]